MKFLDEAKIHIRSGNGGAGSVSFRREKFIEFGGPDGGDGGRGGDVVLECVNGLNTLIDFRFQQHFKAQTGVHGMGKNRHGARGADVLLKVPEGTQVFEEDGETLLADLTEIGERVVLAKGGNGGFGNAYFKSSTNQAPRRANPGLEGEERTVEKFVAVPYDIPKGNVSAYFPEANPLVPITSVAKISNTPTSKYVVVTVVPTAVNNDKRIKQREKMLA